MPALRRLSVMVKWPPAMTVTRVTYGRTRLCFIVTANRIVRYARGRSRIVLIGATDEGLERAVHVVATHSSEILAIRDVTHFDAHVVTCHARQGVQTWQVLERALLIAFRDQYGEPPLCNRTGIGIQEQDEFRYFSRERIVNVLEDLG
jgi:hypothetical protein